MKKLLIALAATALLSGCDGKAKDDLVEQLRLKFEKDTDLSDYHIDPTDMAECVADKILKEIPGFPGSPKRKEYIIAYTKLIRIDPAEDFRPTLEETKEVFGSVRKALETAGSITEHNFSCIGDMINEQPLQGG